MSLLDELLRAAKATRRENATLLDLPEDRLFAYHNTTPDGIAHAQQLGGIPAPSLAVVPAAQPFTSFGDVSLIAPRSLIDDSRFYASDAYSPRQPRAQYPVTNRQADAMTDILSPAYDATNSAQRWELFDLLRAGDPSQVRTNEPGMLLAALRARGGDVDIPMRPKPGRTDVGADPQLQAWVAEQGEALYGATPGSPLWAELSDRVRQAQARLIADDAGLDIPAMQQKRQKLLTDLYDKSFDPNNGQLFFSDGDKILSDIAERARGEQIIDTPALREALEGQVSADEAGAFFQQLFDANSGDPYFQRGRRKVPYTLDNLADAMSTRTRGQENTMSESLAKQRARSTQQFRNVEQARAYAADNVVDNAGEYYSELTDRLTTIAQGVESPYSDTWSKLDDFSRSIGDVMRGTPTREKMASALRRYELSADDDVLDQAVQLAKDVKAAPSEYMEAKVTRGVALDEFGGALVPNEGRISEGAFDTAARTLEDAGVPVERFDARAGSGARLDALNNLRRNAFGIAGAGTLAALTAGQSQDAEAGTITKAGRKMIEAFHGSPHKFDKFSMDSIGTGEGAQAYGHGLYFADEIDVAKNYQPRSPDAEAAMMDRYNAAVAAEDYEAAEVWEAAMLHQTPAELRQTFNATDYGEDFATKADRIAGEVAELPAEGMLARVHIDADPDTLLDWDAPLSEQPESVQRALKQLPDKLVREQIFGRDKWGTERGGGEIYAILQDYFRNGRPDNVFDGGTGALGQSDASGELKSLGIPGLKYLDGNSRQAGEGSRNYVMFDDKPISIVERGAVDTKLLAAMGGGSLAALAGQSQLQAQGAKDALQAIGNLGEGFFRDLIGYGQQMFTGDSDRTQAITENPTIPVSPLLQELAAPAGKAVNAVLDYDPPLGRPLRKDVEAIGDFFAMLTQNLSDKQRNRVAGAGMTALTLLDMIPAAGAAKAAKVAK